VGEIRVQALALGRALSEPSSRPHLGVAPLGECMDRPF
jgi:hypothetical protein